MREIKFRGWSGKRIIPWDELQKLHVNTVFKLCSPQIKLMQFTGIRDIKGSEIYEGDLIRNKSGRICEVTFNIWSACFDAVPRVFYIGDNSDNGECNRWMYSMEAIGNIHENPELAEG